MKVLHYNWVDPEDPAARGGGIRVYLQALVAAQRERRGWDVTTLASGLAHDLRARPPRWRECRPGHYEIVNSASLAPSQADFATPAQVADPATESAFADFLERTGPYDVIHFHSLEGLPAQCLSLTRGARCILSLHNYHPFCPQVNLWHRETAHCVDFDGGKACAQCLPVPPNPAAIRLVYRIETVLARIGMGPGRAIYRKFWHPLMQGAWRLRKRLRVRPAVAEPRARPVPPLIMRRSAMVGLINAHCDIVLAVSERTRQIALGFGLHEVTTCYIGTAHAAHWVKTAPRVPPARISPLQPLRLIYLGYMRADKGFGFLLDVLMALPREVAGCLHLTVAARRGEAPMMARLKALEAHLAGLEWRDGYRRDQLDRVLSDVHFGIVPPLWEDNLPQVALEMHARHIPLVTSDRGGAQELGGSPALRFRAGDRQDFARLIARLVAGEIRMEDYWRQARIPRSIAQHADELAQIYERPR